MYLFKNVIFIFAADLMLAKMLVIYFIQALETTALHYAG